MQFGKIYMWVLKGLLKEGPLLFSLYMQPISKIFQKHSIKYIVMQTTFKFIYRLSLRWSSLSSAVAKLEACLEDLRSWLISNGPKLNDDISEFLLFSTKHMLQKVDYQSCHLHFGTTCITPTKTARNLGVIFDQEMSFLNHITHIQQTVRYQLRNL